MNRVQGIAVWLIATLYVIYELFITNGFYGVSLQLQQHDLSLSVNSIGLLAAVSSLVYAFCQIPAGILVDRFSIRIILSIAALFVTAGMFIYSQATGINALLLARVVISIGSAFAFVSTAVLIGRWLARDKFSLFFGLTQCLGNVSVVLANMFLPQIIKFTNGWKHTSLILGIIGIVVVVALAIIVKTKPKEENIRKEIAEDKPGVLEVFKELAANKQFWIAVVFAGMLLGTLFNFGANWLISFQNVFDSNDLSHSAMVSSIMFLGVAVGNPVFGALSLKLRTRRKLIIFGAMMSTVLLQVLVVMVLDKKLAEVLYFFFGFFCSSAVLVYSVIMDILPPRLNGMGVGICNTVVYLCGAILSILIAAVMKYASTILKADTLTTDQIAFSLFCVAMTVAFGLSFFIKESFKKN